MHGVRMITRTFHFIDRISADEADGRQTKRSCHATLIPFFCALVHFNTIRTESSILNVSENTTSLSYGWKDHLTKLWWAKSVFFFFLTQSLFLRPISRYRSQRSFRLWTFHVSPLLRPCLEDILLAEPAIAGSSEKFIPDSVCCLGPHPETTHVNLNGIERT